jgi:hypothetical protein
MAWFGAGVNWYIASQRLISQILLGRMIDEPAPRVPRDRCAAVRSDGSEPGVRQKQGGVLRVFHRDSPARISILEEGNISAIMPMMGVFDNLVLFDQHVPQNRVASIVPELATSWS